jgi:hypothetical protein
MSQQYSEQFLKKRSTTFNSRRGETRMVNNKLVPKRQLKIDIIKELNESALYLFEYYASVITNPVIDLSNDKQVGKTIGWTARKVKDYRNRLTKAKFILFVTKRKDGNVYNTWIITKEEVDIFNKYGNTSLKVIETADGVSVATNSNKKVTGIPSIEEIKNTLKTEYGYVDLELNGINDEELYNIYTNEVD